jgi:hypothetical protein
MGILDDSDSEDNASTSSSEVETAATKSKVDVGQFMNKKKASLTDYDAFKGVDDEEDETAAKMKEMLQLREALGMDKDVNFLAKQAEKEREKERKKKLSIEERMQEGASSTGDMMAKIRAKQEELSRKKAEEDAKRAEENEKEKAEEEERKQKKKEKKEKKKKKESS